MMPTFTPPTTSGRLIADAGQKRRSGAHALWSHYGAWETGQTVWKDAAGVWHTSLTPYQGGAVHRVFDGGVLVSETAPEDGLATAEKVYLGGHTYTISEADATELVAAGFDVEIVDESFDKADGDLGPDLTWERKVYTHEFPFTVASNECRQSTTGAFSQDDLWVPTPNVSSPDVTVTMDVTDVTMTGTGDRTIDMGAITRLRLFDNETTYRGYAAGIGQNTVVFPGVVTWQLWMFRFDRGTDEKVNLAATVATVGSVTLPGVFTFTSQGNDHTASFSHSGSGPTLSISATDSLYPDGEVALSGGSVLDAGTTASETIDNFSAREII